MERVGFGLGHWHWLECGDSSSGIWIKVFRFPGGRVRRFKVPGMRCCARPRMSSVGAFLGLRSPAYMGQATCRSPLDPEAEWWMQVVSVLACLRNESSFSGYG